MQILTAKQMETITGGGVGDGSGTSKATEEGTGDNK